MVIFTATLRYIHSVHLVGGTRPIENECGELFFICCSAALISRWGETYPRAGVAQTPILHQHPMDLLARKLILEQCSIAAKQESFTSFNPVTDNKINVLRYAAGYIIRM